jgi:peptidoglycan-associated lipoprotein
VKSILATSAAILLTACSSVPSAPAAMNEALKSSADSKYSVAAFATIPASGADPDGSTNRMSQRTIYFAFDNAHVDTPYEEMLKAHAAFLSHNPSASMTIIGNTDERGSREYNLALGQKRAEAVRQLLTLRGAAQSQVEAMSYGKESPKASCHEESCWQENRRADLTYPGSQR